LSNRESFIEKDDLTGTENINPNEMRLPRLAFAQGLSPQLIEEDSSYIPNLKAGDMFDDITGVIFGRGSVRFVPIRRQVRHVLFAEDGKTLERPDVKKDDPDFEELTTWSSKDGKRVPPRA